VMIEKHMTDGRHDGMKQEKGSSSY